MTIERQDWRAADWPVVHLIMPLTLFDEIYDYLMVEIGEDHFVIANTDTTMYNQIEGEPVRARFEIRIRDHRKAFAFKLRFG